MEVLQDDLFDARQQADLETMYLGLFLSWSLDEFIAAQTIEELGGAHVDSPALREMYVEFSDAVRDIRQGKL